MANEMTKAVLGARVLALTIAVVGVSVGPGGVATATAMPTLLGAPARVADHQPATWDDDSGDDSGDDDGDSDVS
jgi:hypothetical protein